MSEELHDEVGTVRWFGESWGAGVNHPDARVGVPVGETCPVCQGLIKEGDSGLGIPHDFETWLAYQWFHKDCFLGGLLGVKVPDA